MNKTDQKIFDTLDQHIKDKMLYVDIEEKYKVIEQQRKRLIFDKLKDLDKKQLITLISNILSKKELSITEIKYIIAGSDLKYEIKLFE